MADRLATTDRVSQRQACGLDRRRRARRARRGRHPFGSPAPAGWGSGALREEDTWVAQLERQLNARLAPGQEPRRCINGGISGAVSSRLFQTYRREWSEPPPELTVVVLSHNDADHEAFRRNLRRLAAAERARGVLLVFVLEPNAVDDVSLNPRPNHRIMREVGAEMAVPVIDMMSLLAPFEDRGLLWWDHVHMSSCGQTFFARVLAAELARIALPAGWSPDGVEGR